MDVINLRAKKAEILQILHQIPAACQGNVSDASTAAQALLVRIGQAALGRIRDAFVVKARGGTDDCGLKWEPLKKSTVAYSRRHPGLPPASKRAAQSPSWMLTDKQRKRWWALYGSFSGKAPGGAAFHAPGASKGWAAARAWLALRAEFGHVETIMSRYGDTQVEILRDTGLLLNSLSPGFSTDYQEPPHAVDQVFRLGPGEVTVGTSRKWAAAHHNGIPGKLPQRRLWAEPKDWPPTWWRDILGEAREGILEVAQTLLERRDLA